MIEPKVQENVVKKLPVVVTLKNTKATKQSGKLTLKVGGTARSCKLDGAGPLEEHEVTLAANEETTVRITEWSKSGDGGSQFRVSVETDDGTSSHFRVIH